MGLTIPSTPATISPAGAATIAPGGLRGWLGTLSPRDRAIYALMLGMLAIIILVYAVAGWQALTGGGLMPSTVVASPTSGGAVGALETATATATEGASPQPTPSATATAVPPTPTPLPNQHAVASTFSHADTGTGHSCANGIADPTDRRCDDCSIADPSTDAAAGHTWSDRNGSTDATDRNAHGNYHAANRCSNHTAVTATADGASCNATTTGANRAQ